MSEETEQEGFVSWFRGRYPDVLIYHTPNGEFRHISTGKKLKLMGVVAGIPDLFIPEWKLWMEFKDKDGGIVSNEQLKIMGYLESVGYKCFVCHGATDASKQILKFRETIS